MRAGGGGATIPGVPAASGGGTNDENTLEKKRESLRKELVTIEKQIYDLEGSYLDETATTGNILVGWEAALAKNVKGSSSKSGGGSKRVTKEERLFSLSSISSPAMKLCQPAAVKTGDQGGAAEAASSSSADAAVGTKRGRAEAAASSSSGNDQSAAKRGPGRPAAKHSK